VLTSYHLGPLTREETRAYIEHRLHAVGWTGDPHWSDEAFATVYDHTGGIPRRINRLCSRVLLYGVLEQTHDITGAVVEATALELSADLEGEHGDSVEVSRPAGAPQADGGGELQARVAALEKKVSERDQVFRRLSQMLGMDA